MKFSFTTPREPKIVTGLGIPKVAGLPGVIAEGKTLDFDIESRPLAWIGFDRMSSEPTIISASWNGSDEIFTWHLRLEDHEASMIEMLNGFKELYDEADLVTGHYIRGYDLTRLQGARFMFDLPLMGPKLTSDTKGDLVKLSGISKSQQNLGSIVETNSPKVAMSMGDWHKANRLDPAGIKLAVDRCEGDVLQHEEMRNELIRRGVLGPPVMWEPGTAAGPSGPKPGSRHG